MAKCSYLEKLFEWNGETPLFRSDLEPLDQNASFISCSVAGSGQSGAGDIRIVITGKQKELNLTVDDC